MIVVANAISVAINISSSRSRIRSSNINFPQPQNIRHARAKARSASSRKMPPGIHVLLSPDKKGVDGRVAWREDALRALPGHNEECPFFCDPPQSAPHLEWYVLV